jgi:hypothetical protein
VAQSPADATPWLADAAPAEVAEGGEAPPAEPPAPDGVAVKQEGVAVKPEGVAVKQEGVAVKREDAEPEGGPAEELKPEAPPAEPLEPAEGENAEDDSDRVNTLVCLAIDAKAGLLYACEASNNRIRKLTLT